MAKIILRRTKIYIIIILITVLLATCMVGETGAYLVGTSGTDNTKMTKATNGIALTGDINTSLTNVRVTNNGNIPMYVRVIPAVNYINDDSGNWGSSTYRLYYADAPKIAAATNNDTTTAVQGYSFTLNDEYWYNGVITETVDGKTVKYDVLYLRYPLEAGDTSEPIFKTFALKSTSEKTKTYNVQGTTRTFTMRAELLVDAVQCEEPSRFAGSVTETAVYQCWGVTPASIRGALSKFPISDALVNPSVDPNA